ncbi:MAG TPA: nucleoside-diphosphate sugar epimerase/dehydratase [Aeromicrobium sp.]|nr:nucleoside-diphosphate sugar epimerase/dehydratase [Aeromicrobium sp.]
MRHAIAVAFRHNRVLALAVCDVAAWVLAFFLAAALRFETAELSLNLSFTSDYGTIPVYGCLVLAAVASTIHLTVGWFLRLHQGRHQIASFEELFTLLSVVLIAGGVTTFVNFATDPLVFPRFSVVTASALALLMMVWPRALWRMQITRRHQIPDEADATDVLIIGAGDAGCDLVRSMHGDPNRAWRPVGFIDDDPNKRHFRYRGVQVLGRSRDLAKIADETGAQTVIIAVPSAPSATIRSLNDDAIAAGLDVKVLPGVNDILGSVSVDLVRDIEPADLLGRHQIETDLESIAHYLRDKTVLVTGAGGSIGSELCRQIRRFAPARLLMLDRDESALHSLALSLDGRADLESPDMVLADIRDRDRLVEVMAAAKPDVVFHAAALKHVNMLERQGGEAFKTNVLGTRNVLDAAVAANVSRFVNISTDKAAAPENVLGYSKRLAEGLTAGVGHSADGTYLSVRFGNVLGTRGSVLTTFQAQIDRGGPVTVTHPDVTRFFMTVGEAVQLVIQAAAIGRDGEALVLDMGEPVKIDDVAKQLIQQSRRQIEIVYTGLKPGEKLHEVLFASAEADERPFHPLVSHVVVPPTSKGQVESIGAAADLRAAMELACETLAATTGANS